MISKSIGDSSGKGDNKSSLSTPAEDSGPTWPPLETLGWTPFGSFPFNQTRPKGAQHFWAKGASSSFQIRSIGYKTTKSKEPSAAPIYECIGVDLVRSNKLISHISSHAVIQKLIRENEPPGIPFPWTRYKDSKWTPQLGIPRLLIVNTQLPYSAPSLWAPQSADSDPGFSLISYYAISPEIAEKLSSKSQPVIPAITLLKRLLQDGSSTKEGTALKAIGLIDNMDELGVPDMIAGYNGKPVLVTKSAKIFSSPEILDIEYDVRQWNILARKSLHSFHDKLKEAKCQMGILIEGKNDDELPEQLLGCFRVNYLDINEALNIVV